MNAARNLSQDVCELKHAIRPTYPQDQVEEFVAILRTFAAKPPQVPFERPVAVHRGEVEGLDQFLRELTFAAQAMLGTVTLHSQLHKDIETLLPRAERSLRVSRAALAALAGDPCAEQEDPDILDAVRKIFEEHAKATAHLWSSEELKLMSEPQEPSAEFDAWLNA